MFFLFFESTPINTPPPKHVSILQGVALRMKLLVMSFLAKVYVTWCDIFGLNNGAYLLTLIFQKD